MAKRKPEQEPTARVALERTYLPYPEFLMQVATQAHGLRTAIMILAGHHAEWMEEGEKVTAERWQAGLKVIQDEAEFMLADWCKGYPVASSSSLLEQAGLISRDDAKPGA